MCCYITVGLDASDTGHLVDATLWKLCVRTTEEVWFISLTPLTRIDFYFDCTDQQYHSEVT